MLWNEIVGDLRPAIEILNSNDYDFTLIHKNITLLIYDIFLPEL